MKIFKNIWFVVWLVTIASCAAIPLIPLPSRKPIRPIIIEDGCACGESLENLHKNWVEANEYIEVLKQSGCFNKK